MLARHRWILAFMSYVSSLGRETDLDAVYWIADTIYQDSMLMDPSEAAASRFGPSPEWPDKLPQRQG
jgi:hypothetical protein